MSKQTCSVLTFSHTVLIFKASVINSDLSHAEPPSSKAASLR